MTPALHIASLTAQYPTMAHPAIENIEFTIDPGTLTMLVGPNGSGKTTIIRSILGLVQYTGTISIFGQSIEDARSNIGYVPQRFAFDVSFPITVAELIHLSLAGYHIPSKQHEHLIGEALERTESSDFYSKRLTELSGGQLQRVLLARALAHKPKLLLLDEPETGIDVAGEQTFYDLLEKLSDEEDLTALVSSHELDIVYAYADNVICVNRHKLCAGIPHEVLDHEMFMKLYGHGLKFYEHEH